MNETTLRVLVIDDDEDDFLIARDLLGEVDGAAYHVEWAASKAAALSRLAADPPCGICLLDYRLGRENGLNVLREITDAGHSLPVILLTGQDDRDVDREAVQIGAADYLVKGKIDAVVLERAIRYSLRQKAAEDTLREQTEFVSAILDTAGSLVIVLDTQGRITRFNRACEAITGYTFAEMQGRLFYEVLMPPELLEPIQAIFQDFTPDKLPRRLENDWIIRSGERRRIEWQNTTLSDASGRVAYVIGAGIDVTERRRVEADLAQAREREIEVGAAIQRTLLTRRPPHDIAGVSVAALSRASERVGGDYFDFFSYDDQHLDVLVGDVMGKGVPAALLAAAAKSEFQGAVRRLGLQLGEYGRFPEAVEVVSAVHNILSPQLLQLNSFVTLVYARFDLRHRLLHFVDCGHPRPLHLSARTQSCDLFSGINVPLGMMPGEVYQQTARPFGPGDIFFFYSDGVTEAADASDELFGEERLCALIEAHRYEGAESIAQAVREAVDSFRAEGAAEDDLTCVVVKIGDLTPDRSKVRGGIEVMGEARSLETLRDYADLFCRSNCPRDWVENSLDAVTMALGEAAGNIVRHAYRGRTDGRIQMIVEVFADRVQIILYDNGVPFSGGDKIALPAFDGSRSSGFGLYLMRAALDSVTHTRDDMGRNATRLIKRF